MNPPSTAASTPQGRRKVPIPATLRDRLVEHLMDGPESGRIFIGIRDSYDRGRAAQADPFTLHECRHGYAALMIAAGVNVKALSTFMVHANIGITLDQYGHQLPGAEDEAADCSTNFWPARLSRLRRELCRTASKPAPRAGPSPCTTSRDGVGAQQLSYSRNPVASRAAASVRNTCRRTTLPSRKVATIWTHIGTLTPLLLPSPTKRTEAITLSSVSLTPSKCPWRGPDAAALRAHRLTPSWPW